MSLHWYACISTNTYCFEMHHIQLEMDWWALSNTSSIVWIHSAVHEILADEAFTATDGLISQSFIVAFVHPTYVRIALIWGFPVQLSLWKSVHWLWRYKLNEVCDTIWYTGKQKHIQILNQVQNRVLHLICIAFCTTSTYASIPLLSLYLNSLTRHTAIHFNKLSTNNPILQWLSNNWHNGQSLSNSPPLSTKHNCRSKPMQLQKIAIFISLAYECIFLFLLSS